MVGIVIPVWNQLTYTKMCLFSILGNTSIPYKIYIVDNGSTDGTKEYLEFMKKKYKGRFKILSYKENRGVVAAWNRGTREALKDGCKYVAVINNDLLVTNGWLENIVSVLENDKDVWVASPFFTHHELPERFPEDPRQEGAGLGKYFTCRKLIGFCFVVDKEALDKRYKEDGYYFDPQFKMLWFEDLDFEAWLLQKKKQFVMVVDSYIHHFESVTLNTHPDKEKYIKENKDKFVKKWPNFNHNRKEEITRFVDEKPVTGETKVDYMIGKWRITSPSNYPANPKGHMKHGSSILVPEVPEWAKKGAKEGYYIIEKENG